MMRYAMEEFQEAGLRTVRVRVIARRSISSGFLLCDLDALL
jgi:hypothetical protein